MYCAGRWRERAAGGQGAGEQAGRAAPGQAARPHLPLGRERAAGERVLERQVEKFRRPGRGLLDSSRGAPQPAHQPARGRTHRASGRARRRAAAADVRGAPLAERARSLG
ncbi:uncharacterized protein LOC114240953 [Bombyx mandarina]|uniref:Uncharacterized protein LOC114240953 n=1 Tax=Bombyx mandarina TaxID=7092 RepID=A0A6J2JD96_BOMMA|nr:uncharacterized protein LOC114240953 [Bombyx mandarina]